MAQIRDLAGLRVLVHGTRADQDEVAKRICALFDDPDRPPRQIDRRADPRQGYRAVHLETHRQGILIEVQVRTEFQHRWAELFERAADKLGRGLRYGEAVPGATDHLHSRQLLLLLDILSTEIDHMESWEADLARFRAQTHSSLNRATELLELLP